MNGAGGGAASSRPVVSDPYSNALDIHADIEREVVVQKQRQRRMRKKKQRDDLALRMEEMRLNGPARNRKETKEMVKRWTAELEAKDKAMMEREDKDYATFMAENRQPLRRLYNNVQAIPGERDAQTSKQMMDKVQQKMLKMLKAAPDALYAKMTLIETFKSWLSLHYHEVYVPWVQTEEGSDDNVRKGAILQSYRRLMQWVEKRGTAYSDLHYAADLDELY